MTGLGNWLGQLDSPHSPGPGPRRTSRASTSLRTLLPQTQPRIPRFGAQKSWPRPLKQQILPPRIWPSPCKVKPHPLNSSNCPQSHRRHLGLWLRLQGIRPQNRRVCLDVQRVHPPSLNFSSQVLELEPFPRTLSTRSVCPRDVARLLHSVSEILYSVSRILGVFLRFLHSTPETLNAD